MKHFLTQRNYKHNVTDFGGDGVTIIFLHGFLASSRYWKKLQPYLSNAGFRVIAIDLLGFGRAPKPRHSDYTYEEHTAYVRTTIRRLDLHSPYILIGHSMGALIAARYARLFPNKVSSLILLHPPLYKSTLQAYVTLRRTNRLYRFLLDSHFRRAGWILIKLLAGFHVGAHGVHAREKSLRNIIEKAEAFDDLATITTQTLLIVGSKDRAEYMENLATHQINPTITLKRISSAHHSPLYATDLIQQLILEFLTRDA